MEKARKVDYSGGHTEIFWNEFRPVVATEEAATIMEAMDAGLLSDAQVYQATRSVRGKIEGRTLFEMARDALNAQE